jgi:hypothetical protein
MTEEYIAYYESAVGHYMPIVAIRDPNHIIPGHIDYREIMKEDIMRITENSSSGGAEGGDSLASHEKNNQVISLITHPTANCLLV